MQLFKDVPFLNGGLFDCLDKPNEEGKIVYVDGFQRNPKKQASVPDYIFFGEEREVDLNDIYATKNKKYKSRGLIQPIGKLQIYRCRKHTVEEEIALDPELLGKVFENLLASYNPETQTTARKQTGSFYTPREIVNYMVDESLLEYIKQNVKNDDAMILKPD
jgi:adenine-specific DNA-methyltransferase